MQNMEDQEKGRWSKIIWLKLFSSIEILVGDKPEKFDSVIFQFRKGLSVLLWQMRIDLLVYGRLSNMGLKIGAKSCDYNLSPSLKVAG